MTVHQRILADTDRHQHLFTRRDYELLSQGGAFVDYAKTELIEGVIYAVNAQYSRHTRVQTNLLRGLANACDALGGVSAWLEASVLIDERTMPRPDIVVVSELPEDGPIPASLLRIAIEVADVTLKDDLLKAQLYARAGVPECWVVDVNGRVIHQLWMPKSSSYTQQRETHFGTALTSTTIPELSIDTSALA